jgi:hypothetical protein
MSEENDAPTAGEFDLREQFGVMFNPAPVQVSFGELNISGGPQPTIAFMIVETAHGRLGFVVEDQQLQAIARVAGSLAERRAEPVVVQLPKPRLNGVNGRPLT